MFGLKSDQVRRDAIKLGNTLTLKQVYDLAKVEESTKAQMEVITKGDPTTDVHAVRSRNKKSPSFKPQMKQNRFNKEQDSGQNGRQQQMLRTKGCPKCGGAHQKSENCPARSAECRYCGKIGHYKKVCFKRRQRQLHEINDEGQGTNLDYDYEEHCSNVGTVDTVSSVQAVTDYPKKLFTVVRLNNCHDLRMKIDTGADTNILTTYDIQDMPFVPSMKASSKILKGYGGSSIDNIGVSALEVSHGNKSLRVNFDIVNAPNGSNSIIGCSTALELGLITANINDVNSKKVPALTKEKVLEEYKDCFDKVGCFPGEKYHIELVDNPKPVVHPARSVPVHLLPLYKAELEMKKADIITEVTEPTEWVNSITLSITQDKNGKMRLRPCLDPRT